MPLYTTAEALPEQSAAADGFFTALAYLSGHYGLQLNEYQARPYPYNVLLAEWELNRKLQSKEKHRRLAIIAQDDQTVSLLVRETIRQDFGLYFIPVQPLYELWQLPAHQPCAELLTAVCAYLYTQAGVSYHRDEDDYMYYNYEMLEEWINDDADSLTEGEYATQKKALADVYAQGDFLRDKMRNPGLRESLGELAARFEPQSAYQQDALSLAGAIWALGQAFPQMNLYSHASQPYAEDDYDNQSVGMHEYISFIGSDEDALSENLLCMVNNDFNERPDFQEPELLTLFDKPLPAYTDELAYEQQLLGLIDDLCTLLYQKP